MVSGEDFPLVVKPLGAQRPSSDLGLPHGDPGPGLRGIGEDRPFTENLRHLGVQWNEQGNPMNRYPKKSLSHGLMDIYWLYTSWIN